MQDLEPFAALGLALGLGLLVGLQRQRAESRLAGIRTFALVTLFGTLAALLAEPFGPWTVAAGLVAVASAAMVGNLLKARLDRKQDEAPSPGQTTEIALLLMYAVGAYLVVGERTVAIVLAGSIAVLLQLKEPMHRMVRRLGDQDFKAIMQFVLLSLVILPVLPNRTFGPYDVLNPYETWLMVVLIVAIGLGGYLAWRLFGQGAGTALGGLLGGLISSTATTVSYSRSSRTGGERAADLSLVVILIASAVVFVRVLVEIAVVARPSFTALAPPLVVILVAAAAVAAVAWLRLRPEDSGGMPQQTNPSEIRSALVFGLLYAGVLLAVAAAKEHFGSSGLYPVAVLSGLTDMDAITLSTARMTQAGRLAPDTAWRLILVASLSNLLFKLGMVAALGQRRLLRRLSLGYGALLVVGALLLVFWPAS